MATSENVLFLFHGKEIFRSWDIQICISNQYINFESCDVMMSIRTWGGTMFLVIILHDLMDWILNAGHF